MSEQYERTSPNFDYWWLSNLARAYEVVENSKLTYHEVIERLHEANKVNSWLRAERQYIENVQNWLAAEKRWHITVEMLDTPVFQAAESGWKLMKELSPNLDGVDEFANLPAALLNRYAAFAKGVLEA